MACGDGTLKDGGLTISKGALTALEGPAIRCRSATDLRGAADIIAFHLCGAQDACILCMVFGQAARPPRAG